MQLLIATRLPPAQLGVIGVLSALRLCGTVWIFSSRRQLLARDTSIQQRHEHFVAYSQSIRREPHARAVDFDQPLLLQFVDAFA